MNYICTGTNCGVPGTEGGKGGTRSTGRILCKFRLGGDGVNERGMEREGEHFNLKQHAAQVLQLLPFNPQTHSQWGQVSRIYEQSLQQSFHHIFHPIPHPPTPEIQKGYFYYALRATHGVLLPNKKLCKVYLAIFCSIERDLCSYSQKKENGGRKSERRRGEETKEIESPEEKEEED